MTITVFVGPSLPASEARALLPHARIEGPAELGDVYRAVLAESTVVAIIDGYFEHRLPVWHKEILWALARGVRVYGAASMGALRAVELQALGMVGVGRVFEWFRDGVLEDDDEVALLHDDDAHAYRPRSDAMVNVRATLAAAVEEGVLVEAEAEMIGGAVKGTPYPQRDLRRTAQSDLIKPDACSAFLSWLDDGGTRDLKRDDARALLELLASDPPLERPPSHAFVFSHTEVWHEFTRSMRDRPATDAAIEQGDDPSIEDVLEEAQLGDPSQLAQVWLHASRLALLDLLPNTVDGFDPAQAAILARVPDALRARGTYDALVARARDKSRRLASESAPSVNLSPVQLVQEHCRRLSCAAPTDFTAFAQSLGFENSDELNVALAREHWYRKQLGD